MVEGHAQVHHRACDDFALPDDRLLLNATKSKYRDLRRIYDWRKGVDIVVGQRSHSEASARHVIQAELTLPRLVRQGAHTLGHAQQIQGIRASEDGYHEAVRDGHSDADVHILEQVHLSIDQVSIESGMSLESIGHRGDDDVQVQGTQAVGSPGGDQRLPETQKLGNVPPRW